MSARHTPGRQCVECEGFCLVKAGPAAEAIGIADRALVEAALPTYSAMVEQQADLLAALQALVDRNFTFFDGAMIGADRKITQAEVSAARAAIALTTGSAL